MNTVSAISSLTGKGHVKVWHPEFKYKTKGGDLFADSRS